MSIKTSFFEVMSEVQKDSEDVSAGIGIFKKIKLLYKFSHNLRSKSARSTLTSPGPIRVKIQNLFLVFLLGQEKVVRRKKHNKNLATLSFEARFLLICIVLYYCKYIFTSQLCK
jgi:hypothetical protein